MPSWAHNKAYSFWVTNLNTALEKLAPNAIGCSFTGAPSMLDVLYNPSPLFIPL